MMKPARLAAIVLLLTPMLGLAACARQAPDAVSQAASTPGFWWGLWHGFIFPFSWIGSLFRSDIAVYAVPNSGGWYDFGFFLGVFVLGGGGHYGNSKRSRRRD